MSLGRAVATVGGFTLLSRVVGFIRDIVLSAVLGSGAVADAFIVAWDTEKWFVSSQGHRISQHVVECGTGMSATAVGE